MSKCPKCGYAPPSGKQCVAMVGASTYRPAGRCERKASGKSSYCSWHKGLLAAQFEKPFVEKPVTGEPAWKTAGKKRADGK